VVHTVVPIGFRRSSLGHVTDPQSAPTGPIRLIVQGNSFTADMAKPFVRLNGYPVATKYGENVHPVPPGPWHVEINCQWLREYGQAAYDVEVPEGQTVDVYYAPLLEPGVRCPPGRHW
jgi:hypothetical protein